MKETYVRDTLRTLERKCAIAAVFAAYFGVSALIFPRYGLAYMLACLALTVVSMYYAEKHQQAKYGRQE
jgi:hypothetical protein